MVDYSTALNFPFLINHTAQVSHHYFDDIFVDNWRKLSMLYQDKNAFFKSEMQEAVRTVRDIKTIEKTVGGLR